jgi:nitrogen regulatory protein PII
MWMVVIEHNSRDKSIKICADEKEAESVCQEWQEFYADMACAEVDIYVAEVKKKVEVRNSDME